MCYPSIKKCLNSPPSTIFLNSFFYPSHAIKCQRANQKCIYPHKENSWILLVLVLLSANAKRFSVSRMRKFKLYAERSGANESYLLRIATLDNSLKCHCGFQGGNDISVLKGNKLDREGCLVRFIPHANTTIKSNSTKWDQPPFIA